MKCQACTHGLNVYGMALFFNIKAMDADYQAGTLQENMDGQEGCLPWPEPLWAGDSPDSWPESQQLPPLPSHLIPNWLVILGSALESWTPCLFPVDNNVDILCPSGTVFGDRAREGVMG